MFKTNSNNRFIRGEMWIFLVPLIAICQCSTDNRETGLSVSSQPVKPSSAKAIEPPSAKDSASPPDKSNESSVSSQPVKPSSAKAIEPPSAKDSAPLPDKPAKAIEPPSAKDSAPLPDKSNKYVISDDELCTAWCILPVGGWLKPDINHDVIKKKLGIPDEKSKASFSEMSAIYESFWRYSKKGILLDLASEDEKSSMNVSLVRIIPPSKLATKEGIRIGSPYSLVKTVYAEKINPEYSDETRLVIGDIYWGTSFYFENSKVSEIYIGASAE